MGAEIAPASPTDLNDVLALLAGASLPTDGVAEYFRHFVVARVEGRVVGSVGMEPHGPSALLRSLVVAPDLRNQGIGQALAKELIARLRQQGTRQVFLLTETTLTFFERLGFRRIPRSEADPAVQQSVEFRSACCESAACMQLDL